MRKVLRFVEWRYKLAAGFSGRDEFPEEAERHVVYVYLILV